MSDSTTDESARPGAAAVPAAPIVIPLAKLIQSETVVESVPEPVPEIGGRRDGPDPTRYGDWEKNGRCIDF